MTTSQSEAEPEAVPLLVTLLSPNGGNSFLLEQLQETLDSVAMVEDLVHLNLSFNSIERFGEYLDSSSACIRMYYTIDISHHYMYIYGLSLYQMDVLLKQQFFLLCPLMAHQLYWTGLK